MRVGFGDSNYVRMLVVLASPVLCANACEHVHSVRVSPAHLGVIVECGRIVLRIFEPFGDRRTNQAVLHKKRVRINICADSDFAMCRGHGRECVRKRGWAHLGHLTPLDQLKMVGEE